MLMDARLRYPSAFSSFSKRQKKSALFPQGTYEKQFWLRMIIAFLNSLIIHKEKTKEITTSPGRSRQEVKMLAT